MTGDEKAAYCKEHGYGDEYAGYWASHPMCEVCHARESEPPHHIKSRGAGGKDTRDNLLALCLEHHGMIHSMGDAYMARYAQGPVGDKVLNMVMRGKT